MLWCSPMMSIKQTLHYAKCRPEGLFRTSMLLRYTQVAEYASCKETSLRRNLIVKLWANLRCLEGWHFSGTCRISKWTQEPHKANIVVKALAPSPDEPRL